MAELLVFQILMSAAMGTACARGMLTASTALAATAVNVLLALSCHPTVPVLVRNQIKFLSCLYLTHWYVCVSLSTLYFLLPCAFCCFSL